MHIKETLKNIMSKCRARNISLLYRVIISFAFIIFIFATSSFWTGSKQVAIDSAFSNVEQESIPITKEAYELQVLVLMVNQDLLNAIGADSEEGIKAHGASFAEGIKKLEAKLAKLEKVLESCVNLQATDPEMLLSIKQVKQRVNQYISLTQKLPALRLDFVKHKKLIDKRQNEFQSLMSLMNKDLQRINTNHNDGYISALILDLDKINFKIEEKVFTAFKQPDSASSLKAFNDLVPIVKDFKQQVEALNVEIPTFKSDMEQVFFKPLYRATTDKKGILYDTYLHLQENEKITSQAAEGENAIKVTQERLAFLQKMADKYSQTASARVHENIDEAQNIFIGSFIIVVLLVIVVSISLVHSIKKPILNLVNVMAQISKGDLSAKCAIHGNDEFSQIGRSLNEVIESDRNVISSIIAIVKQLKETSGENGKVVDAFNKSLDVQKREAFMVASATSELEQTLSLVVESAQKTMDEVTNVAQISELGREIMSKNITTTHTLDSKLRDTSGAIMRVNEMGDKIGNVVSVIRGIAEQTNLLALNAAIEAARAGEHGRGFAVVADEVRTLANRTSESTKTISAVIEELRATITHAVEVIATCNDEMNSSLEQSSKANSSLEEIMGYIHSIEQMTSQIVESSHEQATATREINQNINRISELTEQSCEGMQNIRSSSETLNSISEEQSQIVSKFKL